MNRWNILEIAFYSHHEQVRKLKFDLGAVNIITGASGTGKSAVIQTIDYCFGSSSCEIPAFITDRVAVVALHIVCGNTHAVIGRRIRPGTAKTSHQMFFDYGSSRTLPDRAQALRGETSREDARSGLERLLRISNASLQVSPNKEDEESSRISLRQATAFMYLTKNVIDSDRVLFHGLDAAKSASHIVASIPYFLGAIDARTLHARLRMRGLRKGIESEEKRKLRHDKDHEDFDAISASLLREAEICGIPIDGNGYVDRTARISALHSIARWSAPSSPVDPADNSADSQLSDLLSEKAAIAEQLVRQRRELRATLATSQLASAVQAGMHRQEKKLKAIEFFESVAPLDCCPLCSAPTSAPSTAHKAINSAFASVSRETKVARLHAPILDAHAIELQFSISAASTRLRSVDQRLQELVAADDAIRTLRERSYQAARLAGRVGFFLEHHDPQELFDDRRLELYREELSDLEAEFGEDAAEERLHQAEFLISQNATEIFQRLPVAEPFGHSRLLFNAKKPSVSVVDPESNRRYKLSDLGSDQNYLSLHIALLFGLHRFFAEVDSPIPGILLLDQVSRPYFPEQAQTTDRDEIELRSEDSAALLSYFHFMFEEVRQHSGLQVIVLEHAYFSDDEDYKRSVRYRWRKHDTERLIPSDWRSA